MSNSFNSYIVSCMRMLTIDLKFHHYMFYLIENVLSICL